MDCIVVAGGRPEPQDRLYPHTRGQPKALLPLRKRPMLAYVLAAYHTARQVDEVVVVGLTEAEGAALRPHLAPEQTVHFLPDQGSIIANARSGLAWLEANRPPAAGLLLSTADIPLLSGAIVDDFVARCQPFDYLAYYNVVTRETMEARFPHSRRTFVRLWEEEVAGGDLILAQPRILHTDEALWEALSNARKHAWQLARIVGLRTLLKLLLHRLSLAEVEELASRMFAAPIRVMTSPHAELAMDVDKPEQLELLRGHLQQVEGTADNDYNR